MQIDEYKYEIMKRIFFVFDVEGEKSAGVHGEQLQQSNHDRDYAAAQKTNQ